jgi:hypothetical protein
MEILETHDVTPDWWPYRPDLRPYAVQALLKECGERAFRTGLLACLQGSNLVIRSGKARRSLEAALAYSVVDRW